MFVIYHYNLIDIAYRITNAKLITAVTLKR